MTDYYLRYTLRVNRLSFEKFKHIADCEGRSANKELEHCIKRSIAKFGKVNGEIVLCK